MLESRVQIHESARPKDTRGGQEITRLSHEMYEMWPHLAAPEHDADLPGMQMRLRALDDFHARHDSNRSSVTGGR